MPLEGFVSAPNFFQILPCFRFQPEQNNNYINKLCMTKQIAGIATRELFKHFSFNTIIIF